MIKVTCIHVYDFAQCKLAVQELNATKLYHPNLLYTVQPAKEI